MTARLLAILVAGACVLRAQTGEEWVARGLRAQERFDSRTALECFLKADQERPNNPRIIQAIARQYSDLTLDTADPKERLRLTEEALSYAQRSLALAPKDPVNVLSLAVCYGKIGLESDIETRIADARLVKAYAERALALDPNYDYAHHVLGEWNTEVALLGRTRLFLIRLVYGGLPQASTEEGVKHLERAVALAPGCVSHWAALGKAYLANGEVPKARRALEKALSLPQSEKYDREAKRLAQAALASIS